jgi:lysophospholipase L1-like esterase
MDRIRALNVWLKEFAARNHYAYVDYFSAMLDEQGLLKKDLADDGLHPNATGYGIMAKMLEPAIERSMAKPSKASKKK